MRMAIRDFFKEYILHDVWRKLIALTLALFTCMGIRYMLTQQRTLQMTVQLDYDGALYHVQDDMREFSIRMTVSHVNRDDGNNDWVNPENYDLRVKLPDDLKAGGECRFTIHDVIAEKLPPNVSLGDMQPASIVVRYDRLMMKEVPVRLPADFPLMGGAKKVSFSFGGVDPWVTLTGPERYVRAIDEVHLEQLQLDMSDAVIPTEAKLKVQNSFPLLVKIAPSHIDVMLETSDVQDVRREFTCTIQSLFLEKGLRVRSLSPARVSVLVRGESKVMTALRDEAVFAYVNVRNLDVAGRHECNIQVGGLPKNVDYDLQVLRCVVETEFVEKPAGQDGGGKVEEASGAGGGAEGALQAPKQDGRSGADKTEGGRADAAKGGSAVGAGTSESGKKSVLDAAQD